MNPESLIRVTVCVNRKLGTTEDEFNKYWAYKHGPLATEWLQRNGIIRYVQYEDFEAAFLDPHYLKVIQPDEKNLIDMDTISVTIGAEYVVIDDGKIVKEHAREQNPEDQKVEQPLKDKIILITGGASGIGLSLTKQCHAQGAKVLVSDIRTTPSFETFASSKPNILYVQSDVTKWSDFDKVFAACEKKWNDVPDFYGICAGLFEPPFSHFWNDPEENGYKQVEVNVSHPIKLTRLAMRKSLGRSKKSTAPLYCATKHAIIGFVKSLKDTEPLTGVKITTICPGLVNTPLFTSDKASQFSFAESKALSPDLVAKHMIDLLQKKEYVCGTMLELSMTGPRLIPEWNIPAPEGEGTGQELQAGEMMKALLGPIEASLAKEKGTSKL
ncbi:NAD(P)-binding protein [Amniculicola lignicola CBS 123094]|uniref:NAD(P)-binding protein n=1 Tax=Amniculicola lignicola CBS 123094 TaxID=1392246 RepID=A0A6A5WUT7_9PLEO|nr:NAD(P)-binding protein [Amniculicola lignicola CBS 123094]